MMVCFFVVFVIVVAVMILAHTWLNQIWANTGYAFLRKDLCLILPGMVENGGADTTNMGFS